MINIIKKCKVNNHIKVILTHIIIAVAVVITSCLNMPLHDTVFSRVLLYSAYTYMIILLSLHLEIIMLYLVLKIFKLENVNYSTVFKLLFQTAYLFYAITTLIVILISLILPTIIVDTVVFLIEILKKILIYIIINKVYLLSNKKKMILVILFIITLALSLMM